MISNSQPVQKRERKAIFGCLSLLVFCLTIGGCAALNFYFPEKTGPDNLGHAEVYLLGGGLGCILGGTFSLVSLIRGERPRLPAMIGLALNLLPVFGLICLLVFLRTL